jgi:hypothetical protein
VKGNILFIPWLIGWTSRFLYGQFSWSKFIRIIYIYIYIYIVHVCEIMAFSMQVPHSAIWFDY